MVEIKRGTIEIIDRIVSNKAAGDSKARAEGAQVEDSSALHLFPADADTCSPPALTCSSVTGDGVREIWKMILEHRARLKTSGHFYDRSQRW